MTSGQSGDRLYQFTIWSIVRVVVIVIVARRVAVFARLLLLIVQAATANTPLVDRCR